MRTIRGKDKVIYHGHPFLFDTVVRSAGGAEKRIWRCGQWWNGKCRARVYTIGDYVYPLKKSHTHQEIIMRKKRVAIKKK